MHITVKWKIVRMPNFQDTFEALQRSFVSDFSIYMTVPLNDVLYLNNILLRFLKKLIILSVYIVMKKKLRSIYFVLVEK